MNDVNLSHLPASSQQVPMIETKSLFFSYPQEGREAIAALTDVSATIPRGSHTVILGANGSGKSTFAKLCNGLELPDKGCVLLLGKEAVQLEDIYRMRRLCGMVFQNPDNQIVGVTLEEDVAFGPENLGIDGAQIRERVRSALERVGLSELARSAPSSLSGGQKQKLAIAGILAMEPSCIILDEACAMLDPQSAADFLSFMERLRQEKGMTVIHITHDMTDALAADQLMLLSKGRLRACASPREIFAQVAILEEESLELPPHLELLRRLPFSLISEAERKNIFSEEELLDCLSSRLRPASERRRATVGDAGEKLPLPAAECENMLPPPETETPDACGGGEAQQLILRVKNLSYRYPHAVDEGRPTLKQIHLDLRRGEILVLCGHSGSGKSTLISHFNGILRIQEGEIHVFSLDLSQKENIAAVRRRLGLVFQYPELQLFEATVYEDIAFGPRQMGWSAEKIDERLRETLKLLDIGEELLKRSPFSLSGGQKRRVAIAGVLIMDPEILVMDEPAAGLDPRGKKEMAGLIRRLKAAGKSIVLVTHQMDEAAALADRVAVMAEGEVIATDSPARIFAREDILRRGGLMAPRVFAFMEALGARTGIRLSGLSVEEALRSILALWEASRIASSQAEKIGDGASDV